MGQIKSWGGSVEFYLTASVYLGVNEKHDKEARLTYHAIYDEGSYLAQIANPDGGVCTTIAKCPTMREALKVCSEHVDEIAERIKTCDILMWRNPFDEGIGRFYISYFKDENGHIYSLEYDVSKREGGYIISLYLMGGTTSIVDRPYKVKTFDDIVKFITESRNEIYETIKSQLA